MALKKRLDHLVQFQHPDLSKRFIQSLITQGKVRVDDRIITKPGTMIAEQTSIHVDVQQPKYVSRAGFKLEKAIEHFGIKVQGLTALDAGLSTGGFVDCLLQAGAHKVYGVDVGYGQVHEKIRNDSRVVVYERTNLRNLTTLPELVDLVTLDLSFISVLKVMDAVNALLKDRGGLIVLIKPQFEADRSDIGKGGIVTSQAVHQKVIEKVTKGIQEYGFTLIGYTDSPIEGATGNKEFLAYFVKEGSRT